VIVPGERHSEVSFGQEPQSNPAQNGSILYARLRPGKDVQETSQGSKIASPPTCAPIVFHTPMDAIILLAIANAMLPSCRSLSSAHPSCFFRLANLVSSPSTPAPVFEKASPSP